MRNDLRYMDNQQIIEILNAEAQNGKRSMFENGWSFDELKFIDRIYIDNYHYEDEVPKMVYLVQKEAERRGIKSAPLDELTEVLLPDGRYKVKVLTCDDGKRRFAELHCDSPRKICRTAGGRAWDLPKFYYL